MPVQLFIAYADVQLIGDLVHYKEQFQLFLGLFGAACTKLSHLFVDLLALEPPHKHIGILPLQDTSRLLRDNIGGKIELCIVQKVFMDLLAHCRPCLLL